MRTALAQILKPMSLAVAGVRLKAWWDGVTPDPEALARARAQDITAEHVREPARLTALQLLWGEGRISPGDDAHERGLLERSGIAEDQPLIVLGPGLAGPVRSLAEAHAGPLEALEWRSETVEWAHRDISGAGLGGRVSVRRIDLETVKLKAAGAAGILSLDEFSHCDHPPRLVQQLARGLRPGGAAVIEAYFGAPDEDFGPAFATAFAEPKIAPAASLHATAHEAGLAVEGDEDISEAHLSLAKARLQTAPGRLEACADKLTAMVLREVAWEMQTWAVRRRYLSTGRLLRRRLILRRPS